MAVTCSEVLGACDAALTAKKKELQLSDLALSERAKQAVDLQAQVDTLTSARNSIWVNPWLYLGLGLVGGALLTK